MLDSFNTFINNPIVNAVFKPVVNIVQNIAQFAQRMSQAVSGYAGDQQGSKDASAFQSKPVKTLTPKEREQQRIQRENLLRQRELDKKTAKFDRYAAQTSHKDLRPVTLLDLSEELDNPMYRAIKRIEKEGILHALDRTHLDKALNALSANWGRDEALDARALAAWHYQQSKKYNNDIQYDGLISDIVYQDNFDDYDPGRDYNEVDKAKLIDRANEILNTPDSNAAQKAYAQAIILDLQYHVDLTVNRNKEEDAAGTYWLEDWQENQEFWIARIGNVYSGVSATASALGVSLHSGQLDLPGYVNRDLSDAELFDLIMGPIDIRYLPNISADKAGLTGLVGNAAIIKFFAVGDYIPDARNVVHELGHVLDLRTGLYGRTRIQDEVFQEGGAIAPRGTIYQRNYAGFVENFESDRAKNTTPTSGEDWADSFMAWVYHDFDDTTQVGKNRLGLFEDQLGSAIGIAYGNNLGSPTVANFIENQQYELIEVDNQVQSGIPIGERPNTNSGFVVLTQTDGTRPLNVIGYTETYSSTDGGSTRWVLVEYDGYIGWVNSSNIPSSISLGPELTVDDVTILTGRDYTIEETTRTRVIQEATETKPEITATDTFWTWFRKLPAFGE